MILLTLAHFLKRFYVFILEKREGREKEKERNINVWLPLTHPILGTCHNPGICLDWELNQRLFGLQAGTQSTEPHQPGVHIFYFPPPVHF